MRYIKFFWNHLDKAYGFRTEIILPLWYLLVLGIGYGTGYYKTAVVITTVLMVWDLVTAYREGKKLMETTGGK